MMIQGNHNSEEHVSALDEAIAEYLQAYEAGKSPRPEDWLARYPELSKGLAEFFAAHERVNQWVKGLSNAPRDDMASIATQRGDANRSAPPTGPLNLHPIRTARPALGLGATIAGRFRVFDIKSGGMGQVYLTDDLTVPGPPAHRFAIKTVAEFDDWRRMRQARGAPANESRYADILRRFRQEAMTWVRLGAHPNIILAWWVFEVGAKPYLLLEYADGGTLADWIAARRVTIPLGVSLAMQFCEGMKYGIRTANMVHRDIKPSNVLIKSPRLVKIADLGLCRAFDSPEAQEAANQARFCTHTQSLAGAGTPGYMPPEQFDGLGRADTRSDIFSFGATWYEALTSVRPFAQISAYESACTRRRIPEPHEIDEEIPVALSAVIMRCLRYEPENRYVSFDDLLVALAEINDSLPGRLAVPRDEEGIPPELFTSSLRALGQTFSLISLGRYADAAACAQVGIDIDPGNWEHWLNKSKALDELHDYAGARKCCLQAIRLSPGQAKAWANLGWMELALANPAAGLNAAIRATCLEKESADGWMCRGVCEVALGKFAEAAQHLALATCLEPYNWKAHYSLGHCLAHKGEYLSSRASLARALEINPDDAKSWRLLAWLHSLGGAWEEVIAAVDSALALQEHDVESWVLRACAFWEGKKDSQVAQECLRKASQLDAGNMWQLIQVLPPRTAAALRFIASQEHRLGPAGMGSPEDIKKWPEKDSQAEELIGRLNLKPIGQVDLSIHERDPIWQELVNTGEASVAAILPTLEHSFDGYIPLGEIGTESAVDALIRKLDDADWRKVEAACHGLTSCPNSIVTKARPRLLELSDSPVGEIVSAASAAAMVISVKFEMWKQDIAQPGVPPYYLLRAVEDPELRDEAVRALEEITGEHYGPDAAKWWEWWQRRH